MIGGMLLVLLTAFAVLAFTKGEFEIAGGRKVDAKTGGAIGYILVAGIVLTLGFGSLFGFGALAVGILVGLLNTESVTKRL